MYHIVNSPLDNPLRFRLNYRLPGFDLPTVDEKYARWVIVLDYMLVYARRNLVKELTDRYGKERLVLFDYSDHGHGDYPCTVFAMNARHDFPETVRGYMLPVHGKFYTRDDGSRMELAPMDKKQAKYDVTFVGDWTSHPCRKVGVSALSESRYSKLLLVHEDGFVCDLNDSKMDDMYKESFQTRLMWCPPSRRPCTWRLSEALHAGVPVLTTPFWENTRLTAPVFGRLRKAVNLHKEDMTEFASSVERALMDPTRLERAELGQEHYRNYCRNFWKFVAEELTMLDAVSSSPGKPVSQVG